MRFFFQSLKSKLILLIVLVTLPGVVALFYHSYISRQQAINTAQLQAINTVEIVTAYQAQIITKTQSFLRVLSTFSSLLNPESVECSNALADILKVNDTYINLGVPRADGELLCNATPLNKRVNVANRPYIQQALSTRDFSIGKFQVDRVAGVTSINFAYPVIHPISDEIVGLAVAVVSLDWWSQHLTKSYLPENTVAYLTDRDKKIIAVYPANSELLGTHISRVESNLLESDSNLSQVSKTIESTDNHLRIFVSRPLFNSSDLSGINMSVGIPFGEKLSVINEQLMITEGLLLSFVILMLAIATWGIQKNVLTPLNHLLQSTKKLELGMNVDNQPQQGSSELINLQKRFASMANTRLRVEQQLKDSQSSLQESQSRLSRHIENTPLGCISWDTNFVCTEWNKSAEGIFGYSEQETIGHHASELILTAEMKDEIDVLFSLLLEQKSGVYNTNKNLTKDGRVIICEWHNTCIIEKDGSVSGVTSLVQDITEQKQLEQKLIQAASVFSHAREGILITDAEGVIVDVNDSFMKITGYEYAEVIGQKPSILKSGRQSPEFYTQLWKSLIEKGYWSGETWNKRKDNEIYLQLLTISAVNDESGNVRNYVALFTDITESKKHQLQLEHMAHYDVLTSLPNRSLLADHLNRAIIQSQRNSQPLAVAFLDLDGFKIVNDEYGHQFGDDLLIAIADRIKGALREGDILSRFGGDEFVAILTNFKKAQDLHPILERLLNATSTPISINGILLKVSTSIGVTMFPSDDTDADQLIRHADQAMYIAKQQGKNCYHLFDIEYDGAIKDRLASIQSISTAIKNQEFVLYYQPKVNMKTGEVIGVEALIRWQHPERGLLLPIDFLPFIESHSLIVQIGEWVIDEALKQISKWQSQGLKLSVGVNIPAKQLQQKNFADRLAMLLAAHTDVAPSALQLEVLETSALGDVMDASEIMNSCVKLGVNFAIDDFGTGYSSLTYLRRLPADLIKVDQTFVRDMLVDPEDLAIVAGVIALAKSFNRQVIAEGVETVAHGTALLQLGCELAQGFGIAKPMPEAQVVEWATNWKPDIAWQ